ncbi:hypothetical protein DB32_001416 [Sandaracinus amylolyticus]|uniref:Uncharacterized protein n=1 Tax=Sandaracinus amylolyticus TaxID=927083 RepID=A0A0F6W0G4_9BACT|nr:hypothetical protein DB32_001416 [Sandaracinus amylolyticus]
MADVAQQRCCEPGWRLTAIVRLDREASRLLIGLAFVERGDDELDHP